MKKNLLILGFLLLIAILFFWPAATFKKAFFYFDIIGSTIPLRHFLGERLIRGVFPLWCPQKFGGFPVFADGGTGFLYPPNLLLSPLLTAWKALNISMILNFFLGSCFMFAYLKRKVSTFPAILGGVTFAYSGYFLCHSFHPPVINVAIWLPLIFLFSDMALESGDIRAAVIGACILAVMIFAAFPHSYMMSMLGLSFYLFCRGLFSGQPRGLLICLIVLLLIVLLGIGMGAVQLMPMAELAEHSVRSEKFSYSSIVRGSFPPIFFATLIEPNLFGNCGSDTIWFDGSFPYNEMGIYMGILPLLFLIIALTHSRDRRILAWFALWLTSIVLMLGKYTPFYHIFSHLPYFDRMRLPCRFNLLFSFSTSMLIAFGAEYLFGGRKIKLLLLAIGLISATILVASVYYATYDGIFAKLGDMDPSRLSTGSLERLERLRALITSDTKRAILFAVISLSIIFAAGYRYSNKNLLAGVSIVFVLVDLFLFSRSRVALIEPAFITDAPPAVAILARDKSFFRILSTDDHSHYGAPGWGLSLEPYLHSIDALPHDTPMLFNISALSGGSPLELRRMGEIKRALPKRILDAMNVKYVLSRREINHTELHLIYEDGGVKVYENRHALPRAFAVPMARFAADENEAWFEVNSTNFDPSRYVVLEGAMPIDFHLPNQYTKGKSPRISIKSYQDNEVVIEVEMPWNGFLVLADTFYPGWEVEDNGNETKIYRANYLARAVYLHKGKHTVKFTYQSVSFRWGCIISLLSLLIGILIAVMIKKSAFLQLRENGHWQVNKVKIAMLVILALLIIASFVIEPGNWSDAFPRLLLNGKLTVRQF